MALIDGDPASHAADYAGGNNGNTDLAEGTLLTSAIPRFHFDGDPQRFQILLPAELAGDYQDVVLEEVGIAHEHFTELVGAWLAEIFHKDNINSGVFTWPFGKLDELASLTDEELFENGGSPQPWVIDLAFEKYVVPTISEKGNHFVAMHGVVAGEKGFIGGGLSFVGTNNENEGWMSKGVVARTTNGIENRGKGLGRLVQEGRIMHWMLNHPDKSNLNTGINLSPESFSGEWHELLFDLIIGMDMRRWLLRGEAVTADRVMHKLQTLQADLVAGGATMKELAFTDGQTRADFLERIKKILPVEGFTPRAMRARKSIMVEMARLYGHEMTATEKTFLSMGARLLNGIADSAVVRNKPELAHTRRLLLKRNDWERLVVQMYPELGAYLAGEQPQKEAVTMAALVL